ncbi:hypothetical protein PR202_ga09696 [Eleusine coracana subsp. coracana]|uniref:Non-haem dioxygenase N-terminal domain-containing protein n=1 Tax=Eleusine coracana subsp. coracana TaxID=191504 RepID=A0AAV5C3Q0_ELECO|nr:hypothetical protein PR202_ga09696 [Eleusine coracana subsp. coracana]
MGTASFVTYLQRSRELPVPEFRAPPPSPVTGVLTGSSSGSSGCGESLDDDEIGRFLRCSARVPLLRLPDSALPRRKKKAAWAPPVIDMRQLNSRVEGGEPAVEALKSAAVAFGCFQVVGHGIDRDLVAAALRSAPTREGSSSKLEEMEGIGDEDGEELWWPPGEGDDNMAGNSLTSNGANQFRNRADDLFTQLEQISTKLMRALQQGSAAADTNEPVVRADTGGSLLCIRKHRREQRNGIASSGPLSQDEVLRMLVRESRYSRALALHLCPGALAFHVFSRRGWSRFRPLDGAAVITVGDQLQEWSRELYKSMSGRPAYSSYDFQADGSDDVISAEFFLSCSPAGAAEAMNADAGKVVPLNLQIMVAAGLVLVYHFLLSFLYTTL